MDRIHGRDMAELITWQGKDIEKMSREDLIKALRALNSRKCVCVRQHASS